MPRWAIRSLILVALLASTAAAQKDRVYFRDRATDKVTDLEGDVVETPSGVKFTGGDRKERLLSPYDVVRIDYVAIDPVIKQAAASQENDRDPNKPLAYFSSKLKDLPANAPEKTRRYLQFREAYWASKVADSKANPDEFQAEGKKAAEKLRAFIRANRKTWEQWPLGRTAARTLAELGDFKAADEVLRELAATPDASAELKADVRLARLGYLLRAGDFAAAKTLAGELDQDATVPAGSPRDRLAIYKEALAVLPAPASKEADPKKPNARAKVQPVVSKVEGLIARSQDAAVRGVGYGVLGELYTAHGLDRDAMWSYLTVDAVYPQDRDELVRALHRLIVMFDAGSDKDGEKTRGDVYREKLVRAR